MAKILLVEDEAGIATVVRDSLEDEQHSVLWVNDGNQALDQLQKQSFDLIILDIMLPGMTGLEICRRYRERHGNGHILIVSARDSLSDTAYGLDIGADDYLGKPFHMKELLARVRALLRRPAARLESVFRIDQLLVDTAANTVWCDGNRLLLTHKEFELLTFLARNANRAFSAEELIRRIWQGTSSTETVRTHIKKVRQKLEAHGHGSMIVHERGYGYKIQSTDIH